MPEPFTHLYLPRTTTNVSVTLVLVAGLILGTLWLNLSAIVVAIGVAVIAPALWDIGRNRKLETNLTDEHLMLRTYASDGTILEDAAINLADLDKVTVTVRLDMTPRVTLMYKSGEKHRLHPGHSPPADGFIAALEARNIPVERRHFSFIG